MDMFARIVNFILDLIDLIKKYFGDSSDGDQ